MRSYKDMSGIDFCCGLQFRPALFVGFGCSVRFSFGFVFFACFGWFGVAGDFLAGCHFVVLGVHLFEEAQNRETKVCPRVVSFMD